MSVELAVFTGFTLKEREKANLKKKQLSEKIDRLTKVIQKERRDEPVKKSVEFMLQYIEDKLIPDAESEILLCNLRLEYIDDLERTAVQELQQEGLQ